MNRANGAKFWITLGGGLAIAAAVIVLQLRSGSWEAADAVGGALGIHAAYIVPVITLLVALRSGTGDDSEATTQIRKSKAFTYSAMAATLLGASIAIFVVARGDDMADCVPDAKVNLFARQGSSRSVEMSARVEEEAACENSLWLVLQIHDVNGHSEFYPRQRIRPKGETDSNVTLPPQADITQRRTARIYEVDELVDGKLDTYSKDGDKIPIADLVKPPCSGCGVSTEVELPYRD
ncbi:hypothetical protein [Actinoplanes couchii]|uniref:Uncharacterized protein n=1 Tax=Actinoplanes couchii TaxID=403638 RepID=A0ABQ3XTG5_9ACTN|nr:hypothetical protein [Actinoplanes couchii]MDR6319053.1 hypothetical protein [Actinoplanes couchii]GID61760.1 hypothetical protein Aco03nite_101640 [Actinoplanes couchii]